MAQPRVLILRAPGTNCDVETAFALTRRRDDRRCTSTASWRIPSGSTSSRSLRPRRIQLRRRHRGRADPRQPDSPSPGRRAGRVQRGKLMLGICNGFQVLLKLGHAVEDPARRRQTRRPRLTWNDSGKFEDRWVQLRASGGSACSSPASRRCTCRWPMPKASSSPATGRSSTRCKPAARSCSAMSRLPSGTSRTEGGLSRQSQRIDGGDRGRVRRHGASVRIHAASRAARGPDAASALDAGRGRGRGRWTARVPQRGRVFSLKPDEALGAKATSRGKIFGRRDRRPALRQNRPDQRTASATVRSCRSACCCDGTLWGARGSCTAGSTLVCSGFALFGGRPGAAADAARRGSREEGRNCATAMRVVLVEVVVAAKRSRAVATALELLVIRADHPILDHLAAAELIGWAMSA